MKIIIGGTFSYLHKGHQALIRKAFEAGDFVFIGLTTDKYVESRKGKMAIEDYQTRESNLRDFIKQFNKKFEIEPLEDKFGPKALDKDFEAIVVSRETHPTANEINEARKEIGVKELEIIEIDYVLAEDKKPISSTRIFNGEIDRNGKLIR